MLGVFGAVEQIISLIMSMVLVHQGVISLSTTIINPSPTPTVIPTPSPTTKPQVKKIQPATLNQAVNSYRLGQQLSSLKTRSDICLVAGRRLEEIKADFSHNRMISALSAIPYQGVAENIWHGPPSAPENIVQAWDGSEGHRNNLRGGWQFGCGAVSGTNAVYIFLR